MSKKRIACSTPGCLNSVVSRSNVCRTCWNAAKRAGGGSGSAMRKCLFCDAGFRPDPGQVKRGLGEFCSTLCCAAYRHAPRAMGTFGDDLRQARLEARITSTTIAEAIGCSKQHVCQVERGVSKASEKFQAAVRSAFPELKL